MVYVYNIPERIPVINTRVSNKILQPGEAYVCKPERYRTIA
ncbi:hypothetical protein OkiPb00545_49910 [Escherichia coli]